MKKGIALGPPISSDGKTILVGPTEQYWLKVMGITYLRLDFQLLNYASWDSFLISQYKKMLSGFIANGQTIIGLLNYGILHQFSQAAWCANNTENGGSDGNNAFISQFVNTVKLIVKTFPEVTHWEIWNEPNGWEAHTGTVYSGGTYIYPSNYVQLIQQTYDAIKGIRPSSTIITGGLFAHNNSGVTSAHNAGADYLQDLYNAGAWYNAEPFDALGYHLYIDQAGSVDPSHVEAYIEHILQVTSWNDQPGNNWPMKTLYITEIAWRTDAVSEAVQASNLTNAYNTLSNNPQIETACWFSLNDRPNLKYGLFHSDWSTKPASQNMIQVPKG